MASGRSGGPEAATSRPSRCGRRERRARSPAPPASSATTSRCRVRTGRPRGHSVAFGPHRAGPARRSDPGGPAGARRDGLVGGRRRRARARGRQPARRPRPRRSADAGGVVARRGRASIPVLGELRPADDGVVRHVATAGPAATDVANLGALPADRDLRRPMGGCGAFADRARRRELARRLAPPRIPRAAVHCARASTSTPPSSPRAAPRSGSSSMPIRRWRRAACCRGPDGCGHARGA